MELDRDKPDGLVDRIARGETKDDAGNAFEFLEILREMFPNLARPDLSREALAGNIAPPSAQPLSRTERDDVNESKSHESEVRHTNRSSKHIIKFNSTRSQPVLTVALRGFVLAASVLLGVFVNRFLTAWRPHLTGSSCEVILANVTPVPDSRSRGMASRSPNAVIADSLANLSSVLRGTSDFNVGSTLAVTGEGSFAIAPASTYGVVIRSPRSGWATVIVLDSEQPRTYPKPNQERIAIQADRPFRFYPLQAPRSSTPVLAIVTDPDATEVINGVIQRLPREARSSVALVDRVQEALVKAGHSWAVIGQVTVEPAGSKPR